MKVLFVSKGLFTWRRVTLLGGSPHQKDQNIAFLYMPTRQARVTPGIGLALIIFLPRDRQRRVKKSFSIANIMEMLFSILSLMKET